MTKGNPFLAFNNITQTVGFDSPTTLIPGEFMTGYSHMDVICIVNTISGVTTTAGVSVFFQEAFATTSGLGSNGTVFLTTARISNITTTGVYYASYDPMGTSSPYASPSNGSNTMLGKGMMKQLQTTAGAVTAFNMDVILVPWA